MRTLLLLRHAKSSWDDPEQSDHERPLTKRGTKDAARMGAFIRDCDLVPDLVLCSGAVRARATLTLALTAFGNDAVKVLHDDVLYLADPTKILERLGKVETAVKRVMIVGHNPGLHVLALALVRAGDPSELSEIAQKYPTAGLAVIHFDARSWKAIEASRGLLRMFMTPKRLP